MIRLAVPSDAEQLHRLNSIFNDSEDADIGYIENTLKSNTQEIVVVSECNNSNLLNGYICIQLKRSIARYWITPELTEVFVHEDYRRQGIASEMLSFAEEYLKKYYDIRKIELLTRKDNHIGQSLYKCKDYAEDIEMHMSKNIE